MEQKKYYAFSELDRQAQKQVQRKADLFSKANGFSTKNDQGLIEKNLYYKNGKMACMTIEEKN